MVFNDSKPNSYSTILIESCKLSLQFFTFLMHLFGSIFCCIKRPQIMGTSVASYASFKFLEITTKFDAFMTSFISSLFISVGNVLGPSSLPQIAKPIIVFNAIDVINILRWPFPIKIKPRQTVSKIKFTIYGYYNVTKGVFTSCLSSSNGSLSTVYPEKMSSFWVVCKGFKQFFMTDSHSLTYQNE